MSTRTSLWALACISTSLGAAAAGELAAVRALELELDLARQPALYLTLSLDPAVLEVKARGRTLEPVELAAVEVLEFRSGVSADPPGVLELPAIWEITSRPAHPERRVVVPPKLRKWGTEAEEEEEAAAPAEDATPPGAYVLKLDNGWHLWVGRPVDRPLPGGWTTAVADGWRVLLGRPRNDPPQVILDVTPETARRLHHLFRPGLKILVEPSGKEPVTVPPPGPKAEDGESQVGQR